MEDNSTDNSFQINKGYEEELKRYRELAAKDRDAYLHKVAAALINMGELNTVQGEIYVAHSNYEEALMIYRILAVSERRIYLSQVASMLSNMADLDIAINPDKALYEYEEALAILREIASWGVDAYLPLTVRVLINLSRYYMFYEKDKRKSIYYAQEALKLIEPIHDQSYTQREYFINLIRILKTNGWKY